MSQFTSETDLKLHYQEDDLIRLSNSDDSSATTINSTVLDDAITQAEGIVKSYLRARYKVDSWTTSTVPEIVKFITRRLAMYLLYERKYSVDEQLKNIYTEDMEVLAKLRDSKMVLDTDPDDTEFETKQTQDSVEIFTPTSDDKYNTESTV
jgi:phage gp36-like protein